MHAHTRVAPCIKRLQIYGLCTASFFVFQAFCAELTRHVSNTSWTVGELFLVDNTSLAIQAHASFLDRGGANGVFAFPMAIVLEKVLRVRP